MRISRMCQDLNVECSDDEESFTCETGIDNPVENEVDDGDVSHWHKSF